MQKQDLFYCYSIKLFHFLKQKRFYYICKGYNERTNKNYWVFLKNEAFDNAMVEYKKVWHEFK